MSLRLQTGLWEGQNRYQIKHVNLNLFISREIVLKNLRSGVWTVTWLGEHTMCSSTDLVPLNPEMSAGWINKTIRSKSGFQQKEKPKTFHIQLK